MNLRLSFVENHFQEEGIHAEILSTTLRSG
jgi:hypothetical protein